MSNKTKNIAMLVLVLLALSERLWWDLGNNVELITLVTFITAFYINKKAALFIPLFILAISDIYKGNTSIAFFTWSAFLAIVVVTKIFSHFKKTPFNTILLATGGGVIASLWFYAWTNFGVWLLDSYGMYSNDLAGLLQSYMRGLPFLKNHLTSNALFIFCTFSVVEFFLSLRTRLLLRPRRIAITIT